MAQVLIIESVIDLISSTLISTSQLILGLDRDVNKMREKLQTLQGVLKDAGRVQDKSERIHQKVKQIKNLVFKIQDTVEIYDVYFVSPGKTFSKRFFDIQRLHNLALQIKDLKLEVDKLYGSASDYAVLLSGVASIPQNGTQNQMDALHLDDEFIGLEMQRNQLKKDLMGSGNKGRVISIWGMGCTGKTALAKVMYNDTEVEKHFSGGRAWVHVAEDVDASKILDQILKQLLPFDEGTSHKRDMYSSALIGKLQNSCCLVVLDDLWSVEAWDMLRVALPSELKTSRILLTTRTKDVASLASGGTFLSMGSLTEEEAWELFQRNAFSRDVADSDIHPTKKEIGKALISRWRGLPLAIVKIGQFMRRKRKIEEWERVETLYIRKGLQIKDVGAVVRVLASSFYNLPHHLKQCFLYLGHFPEDSEIEAEKLYLMWIAEDMISSDDLEIGQTMMGVAEEYLTVLATRSMVEVNEEELLIPRRLRSCHLHKLMRELCLLKGKDEFKIIDSLNYNSDDNSDSSHPGTITRHLGIELDSNQAISSFPPNFMERAIHVRSILVHHKGASLQSIEWPKEMCDLKDFRVVRVLDFDRIKFDYTQFPKGLGNLMCLRYLSFKRCFLVQLPASVGRLLNLETLDLRVEISSNISIPNVLCKLKQLKHLYLPLTFQTKKKKLKLSSLILLETLENFNTKLCNVEDLTELKSLSFLGTNIDASAHDFGKVLDYLNRISKNASYFWSVALRNCDCYGEEKHLVLRNSLSCKSLHNLYIEGHIHKIPLAHQISQNLIKVVFSGSEFEDDPMPIMEVLPHLQVLVLHDNAFVGKTMVCTAGKFPELRHLQLSDMEKLESWDVEEKAMAELSYLVIENCRGLKTPPELLSFISKVKTFKFPRMPDEFQNTVTLHLNPDRRPNPEDAMPDC